jgi:hypothetical protein
MSEMQTARSSLNGWGTDQAPQNDQLMSENRILCLKSALRLEWRGQNGQDEAEQSVHGLQMLGDSFGQSMRMKFSVHTAAIVRFVPLATDAPQQKTSLFDQVVGEPYQKKDRLAAVLLRSEYVFW